MSGCPWPSDVVRAVAARTDLDVRETADMLGGFARRLATAEAAARNDETPTGDPAVPAAADEGSNSHHSTDEKLS